MRVLLANYKGFNEPCNDINKGTHSSIVNFTKTYRNDATKIKRAIQQADMIDSGHLDYLSLMVQRQAEAKNYRGLGEALGKLCDFLFH